MKRLVILIGVVMFFFFTSCSSSKECVSLKELRDMSGIETRKTLKAMSESCFNTLFSDYFSEIKSLDWSEEEAAYLQIMFDKLDGNMYCLYSGSKEGQEIDKWYDDWSAEGQKRFGWSDVMKNYFVTGIYLSEFNEEVLTWLREGKDPLDEIIARKDPNKGKTISRKQWLKFSDDEKPVVFSAMNGESKYAFWIDKIKETKKLSWSKEELAHLVKFEDFLKANKKDLFLSSDMAKKDSLYSGFVVEWINEGMERFGWTKDLVGRIVADGNPIDEKTRQSLYK